MTRTLARGGAAAAMVVMFLVLMPAAPASADVAVHVSVSASVAGSTGTIAGDAAIDQNALGLSSNTITGVTIQVHGATSPNCSGCGATYGQPRTHFSYPFSLPYNGRYTADVLVTGQEDFGVLGKTPHSQSATVGFAIDAPPAAPTGVKATANGDRTVTVTWRANSEPDIIGYQVQRQPPDGQHKSGIIGRGAPLTWTDGDTTQTGGRYSYAVYVARPGADGPTGSPMVTVSPTAGVDVPAPPPPSTTADGSVPPPLIQPTQTTLGSGGGLVTPTLDLSGFLSKTPGGGAPAKLITPGGPAKLVTPSPEMAPDTGFQPTLPFPVTAGRNGGRAGAGGQGALGAQPAGSSSSTTRRTILLPFAAGLFLCVVGIHVRWFNKRIGGDGSDPALLPVEDPEDGGSAIRGGTILPAAHAAVSSLSTTALSTTAKQTWSRIKTRLAAGAARPAAPATGIPATDTAADAAAAAQGGTGPAQGGTGAQHAPTGSPVSPLDDADVLVTW